MKGNTIVTAAPATEVSSKNCASLTKCIAKTKLGNAEDLDLVMLMYNLIEYSSNYFETTGRLWLYSKDETTNFDVAIINTDNFKSFKCKAKLLSNTAAQLNPNQANGILKNATIVALNANAKVTLKYLNNFWKSLEMSLINCKVESKLKWTKYYVLSAAGNDNTNPNPNNVIFTIIETSYIFL